MAKTFGDAERHICSLFSIGRNFILNGTQYSVNFVGKPTCSRGEPKTDIYIRAVQNSGVPIELKITFKKQNADFLENKTNSERAEQLFGSNWSNIISNATQNLRNSFESRPLIYKESYRRTEKGAITVGWKFELLNVDSGQLSGSMNLSRSQILDVYAGTNLTGDKKNANVNGIYIPNSGIANCILFEDAPLNDIQSAVNALKTIDAYVDAHPQVYFACKALNYRTFAEKYDGNRPLAVYVDWSAVNGRLHSSLVYDTPLIQGGDYAVEKLLRSMLEVGIRTTDDINTNVVTNHNIIMG
jgi:hypothetical protein